MADEYNQDGQFQQTQPDQAPLDCKPKLMKIFNRGVAAMVLVTAAGCASQGGMPSYPVYPNNTGNGYGTNNSAYAGNGQPIYQPNTVQSGVQMQHGPWEQDQRYQTQLQAMQLKYQNDLNAMESRAQADHLRCQQRGAQTAGRVFSDVARNGANIFNAINGAVAGNDTLMCNQNIDRNLEQGKINRQTSFINEASRFSDTWARNYERDMQNAQRQNERYMKTFQQNSQFGGSQEEQICKKRELDFLKKGQNLPAGDACRAYIR